MKHIQEWDIVSIHLRKEQFLTALISDNVPYRLILQISRPLNKAVEDLEGKFKQQESQ